MSAITEIINRTDTPWLVGNGPKRSTGRAEQANAVAVSAVVVVLVGATQFAYIAAITGAENTAA